MKPVAPLLPLADPQDDEPSLQSEIVRMCDERDARADNERITLPAPPTPETLRLATPCPPRDEPSLDTIPAPPPSAARKRDAAAEMESVPSTIPGPPRIPRIAEA
jgi:hypothetical protein